MKRFITCAVVAVLVLSMVGSGAEAAKKQVWKLSHVRPQGTTIDKDLHAFADRVGELTEGRIDVQIYGSNQLGDYSVVQESVGVGSVEMSCQPLAVGLDKRLQIMWFPYMVANWDQVLKNYCDGAPLMKVAADLMKKQDIHLLSSYPVYFGGIALKKDAPDPGNPDVKKNLKVRVPPVRAMQLIANDQGYQATPIPFSEAFTALQTGIVDGVLGSGAEGYYANFRDVIKYYSPVNTHFECWYLYMNMEIWNDLSKEDQALVAQASKEFGDARLKVAEKDQAYNEQRLRDYGIEVYDITPEQINYMAAKAKKEVWPKVKKDIGAKWADSVLSQIIE